jgi:hypothetical protein
MATPALRTTDRPSNRHRLTLAAIAALAALLVLAAPAAANDRFTLDPAATSPGHLIEDAAGNAYIGWVDNGETAKFCKVPAGGTCTDPLTLPIPGAKGSNIPDQVLPVFGGGETVYAVGPGYLDDSAVVWTSTNGGVSFNNGVVDTSGYPNMGEPNTVLLNGGEFWIAASHVGVGFGSVPTDGIGGSKFGFADPGVYAGDATLGLAAPGEPVEAYYEDVDGSPIQFYRYKGSGSVASAADWDGPTLVAEGEVPRLASGGAGLLLLSADATVPNGEPEAVQVRRYSGTSFGAPLTLLDGPPYGGQVGGAIGESADGEIAVAWPTSSGSTRTMQLWVSTDAGLSYTAVGPIAHLGSGYETGANAQISLNDSGAGWLTYRDSAGLQVADLTPLPVAPPATGGGATTPPKATTPKPYSGATQTFTTVVGGEELTLKVPKACLAAEQPFYVGVGKVKRHGIAKKLRTPIKVDKMTFTFATLKKTLKKKPYRWLIHPPALVAGHKYLVKARVTVTIEKGGKKKTVVKTLKGQVSIC